MPSPLWLATVSASEPSWRASSSITTARASAPMPAPPYSSGTRDAQEPERAELAHDLPRELAPSRPSARACGFTFASQKLAHGALDLAELLRQLEVHDLVLSLP